MKDEQILKRAIDKAVENKWLDLNVGLLPNDYICTLHNKIHILGTFKHFVFNSLFEIIFSHSFAKAFWGDEKIASMYYDVLGVEVYVPAWWYHLRRMVVEEKPLQYLEKYLDGRENA